jgi:dipeptidyl-peptidase-4
MNILPRVVLLASLLVACLAQAERIPLEQIFASPNINGTRPVKLSFSPDGERVTYLRGKKNDQRQQDLWEYHVAEDVNRLLVDSKALVPDDEQLDDVEKARRERMRHPVSAGRRHLSL